MAVRLLLVVFALLMASASSARAALLFCNRTKAPVEAAVGYREGEIWVSEGWWQIQPGLCARVYSKPLSQRFYFYYARSLAKPAAEGKAPPTWGGKYAFCTAAKAFKIVGDGNCDQRSFQAQGFHEIDIGSRLRDYTLNLQ